MGTKIRDLGRLPFKIGLESTKKKNTDPSPAILFSNKLLEVNKEIEERRDNVCRLQDRLIWTGVVTELRYARNQQVHL